MAAMGDACFLLESRYFLSLLPCSQADRGPWCLVRKLKIDPSCLGSQHCVTPGRDVAVVCHVAFRSLPRTTVSVTSRIGA